MVEQYSDFEQPDAVDLDRSPLSRALSAVSVVIAGVFMVALLVVICAHIVLRAFGKDLAGANELARFSMAFSGFFGFAYAFFERSHVRVNILIGGLKGRAHLVVESALTLALMLILIALSVFWGEMTYSSFFYNSVFPGFLPVPNWIVQVVMLVALALFGLQVALHLRFLVASLLPSAADQSGEP